MVLWLTVGINYDQKQAMSPAPSHSQQIRLFRNERIEKLTVVTPRGFLATWAVLLAFIGWTAWGTASLPTAVVLIGAGLIGWGLFEYAMHRFVFHWQPDSPMLQQFVFIMHGNHHADPNDPLRNLMPPIAGIPINGAVWLTLFVLFGASANWAFFGFIAGYICYDMLHYACHQWPMKGRVGMMFKRHHMRQHHGAQEGNYAISTLFFDRLFRTRVTSLKRG